MSLDSQPTVRTILDVLVTDLRPVLGGDLIGLYLYGSTVTGGFDPGVSDVDLVAVTRAGPNELDLNGLDRVHRSVVDRHPEWADRLEILYVDRAALASPETNGAQLAVISPGEPFHVTGPASDWLQNWYLLRETGIALIGPPASEVVPSISRHAFINAVVHYVEYLRTKPISELGPGALAYSVLSVCRALTTVRAGRLCSKQEGAAWVREQMRDWAWLIDLALACRLSGGTKGFDDDRTHSAAIRLIELLADQVIAERSLGQDHQ
jgi:predicted nucleotidyltransferase